jgi:hypothetical protein
MTLLRVMAGPGPAADVFTPEATQVVANRAQPGRDRSAGGRL